MKKLALIVVLIFGLGLVFSGFAQADYDCEGCTPGYWKNVNKHLDSWCIDYSPDDQFGDVFMVGPSTTLSQVLKEGGGGEAALGRQAVAALLNACSEDLNYPLRPNAVKGLVWFAYYTERFELIKDLLESLNDQYCPLN